MTVNYTTNLGLGQPVTGTESGTWGDDVNNAVTSYLDIAISGTLALTSASFTANALTIVNTQGTSSATNIGAPNGSSQWTAQYYVLRISTLSANVTITAPSVSKTYLVVNADATYSVTVKASGGTGISIAPGERATVYYNGTDYIKVTSSVVSNLTGVLPVANGGTGVTTSTGSGNNVLSTSPTFVTPILGTPTSATLTNATGLPLTSGVTGTLPVANGGTGVTASTGSGSVVLSTSPTLVTPALGTPASGVLTNATGLPLTSGVTGTLPVANGGTGVTTSTGSGSNVLSTSPTLVTPLLGTPTSGNLANCTFPTLNQNTTGTAAGLSATLAVASGGTGVTTSTGSGSVVLSTSPTLVTPLLGTPTSGNLANCTFPTLNQNTTGTAAGLSATLAVASGGTGVTTSTGTGSVVLSASPTLTGTPLAPTAATSTNTTQLATTAFVQTALQLIYPVGSIYTNASNATNPGTLFGFGTWAAFGAGRVMLGVGTGGGGTYTAGTTSGSKDAIVPYHTHTTVVTDGGHAHNILLRDGAGGNAQHPNHSDGVAWANYTTDAAVTGISVTNNYAGTTGNLTDANLQPYIVVYMWQRTA